MNTEDLKNIKRWYREYTSDFLSDKTISFPVRLKISHIRRVVKEADMLARSIQLSEEDKVIALTTAWLHDVGRFPQIRIYNNMNDRQTENHAILGLKTVDDLGVLNRLNAEDSGLIRTAIFNHNRLKIEDGLNARELLFCRLIRDADKLDIWKVMLESDRTASASELSTVFGGLPELPEYSEAILNDMCHARLADVTDMKTRNDFRLLMLTWVYDLSFTASFRAVKERGYVDEFESNIPQTKEIQRAVEIVKNYAHHKANECLSRD